MFKLVFTMKMTLDVVTELQTINQLLTRSLSLSDWQGALPLGPLMGASQCRMSILRNGSVACHCRLFSPMSHVKFKKRLCHMSLIFCPCCMSISPMSHVEFKKWPCYPVNFRGQGPCLWAPGQATTLCLSRPILY